MRQIIRRYSRRHIQRRGYLFRVAFKPVSTILMEQQTVDIGNETIIKARGRRPWCSRAVPIVEAMAA